MEQPDGKGKSQRSHLEGLAVKGHAKAIEALQGPEYPPELHYLRMWAAELHGKSGVGMNGLNPLTYTTVADWSRLKGVKPEPHEVEALLTLDAVMLFPGEAE